MKNSKQPISPQMFTRSGEGEDDFEPLKDGLKTGYERKFSGLNKREYFAGIALQGLLASFTEKASNGAWDSDLNHVCDVAVSFADILLEKLNK